MKTKSFLLLLLAGLSLCLPNTSVAAGPDSPWMKETPQQRDARMKWFREARFGMFIHWGLYSVAAGEWNGKPAPGAGEWIMNDMETPLTQYAKLVPQFNPVQFNAREWVKIAKAAGMKYIVITSKHHDGFAVYPTAQTDWSMKSTPFKRDPLKELAEACKEEGITFCLYHSIMDWHHPDYAPRKPWNDIDKNPPQMERYVDFMKAQLKELLTGYGPIGIMWFDGQWENSWNYDRGVDLYNFIRGLQPNIIVNNRVGQDRKGVAGTAEGQEWVGDYGTPEQFIPARGYGPGVYWESCMTMNGTWGFKKDDHKWKSTEMLVRNLIDCASKGGNYLLNVGPTGEGLIPGPSIERLRAMGDWLKTNGDAIYATTASPFDKQLPWGRCTKKADGKITTLYLHVFDWPTDGELLLPGLQTKAEKAWLLSDAKKTSLMTRVSEEGLVVTVPKNAPDRISSTVVLTVKEPLRIEPAVITQRRDGSISLPAVDARLHGKDFRYESGGALDNIGYWTNSEDWADWEFKVKQPGKFVLSAIVSAPASGAFEISVGGQTQRHAAPITGDFFTFQPVKLGIVEIASTGTATLAVRPVKDSWQPMNLKAIRLEPVMANP